MFSILLKSVKTETFVCSTPIKLFTDTYHSRRITSLSLDSNEATMSQDKYFFERQQRLQFNRDMDYLESNRKFLNQQSSKIFYNSINKQQEERDKGDPKPMLREIKTISMTPEKTAKWEKERLERQKIQDRKNLRAHRIQMCVGLLLLFIIIGIPVILGII